MDTHITTVIKNDSHSACFLKNEMFYKIYFARCCSEYELYCEIYNTLPSVLRDKMLLCKPSEIKELPFCEYLEEFEKDEVMVNYVNKWLNDFSPNYEKKLRKNYIDTLNCDEMNNYRLRVFIMPFFPKLINIWDFRNIITLNEIHQIINPTELDILFNVFLKDLQTTIFNYLLPNKIYIMDIRAGNICFDLESKRFVLIDFDACYSYNYHMKIVMSKKHENHYILKYNQMCEYDEIHKNFNFIKMIWYIFPHYVCTIFNPPIHHYDIQMTKKGHRTYLRMYKSIHKHDVKRKYTDDIDEYEQIYFAFVLKITIRHCSLCMFCSTSYEEKYQINESDIFRHTLPIENKLYLKYLNICEEINENMDKLCNMEQEQYLELRDEQSFPSRILSW
jgi:hypothetical protein